jgi:transposase-like protein
MKHTADWWSGPVAELAATGDASAVARRHGVRERTLIWWRSELRRRAREAKAPRLLPVVVRASSPRPTVAPIGALEVVVEIGAARMTLRGAVSVEHIAAIVTASSNTC